MAGKDEMGKSEKEPTMAEVLGMMAEMLKQMKDDAKPPVEPQMSPDELAAKLMAEIRGQSQDVTRFGLVELVCGCRSDFTDSTFDAEIHHETVVSGGKVLGRRPGPGKVVALHNYAEPAEASVRVQDGGKVPMDMTETTSGGGVQQSMAYGQWKWETYWQADLRRFVGRPLPAHVRQEAKTRTEAAQTGTT